MEHVGIDLGAVKSHVVRINATGEVVERWAIKTTELDAWLRRLHTGRVVMEACTQSTAVARLARSHGHEVIIVSGTLVRALGVGARGIKTDERDAEVLARASLRNERLPSVHLRSEPAVHQRALINSRCRLVKMRAQCASSIKSYLRGRLLPTRGRANPRSFATTVRDLLQNTPDGLPTHIDALLETFDFLTKQIESLETQIEAIVEQSAPCIRLMELPGVGPHVALSFVSTIDDPTRFRSADELASYLALAPGESTTGGKIHRTGTLRVGPVWLKALLVQAAWVAWRSTPDAPMVCWAKAIADKRGKRIAIVALARKLATVMWAMWKSDTPYQPERAARTRATLTQPSSTETIASAAR